MTHADDDYIISTTVIKLQKLLSSTERRTHITLVPSHISPAGGAIATGFVFAVVHLAFAVASSVVRGTFAIVGIPSVDAVAAVMAQLVRLDA